MWIHRPLIHYGRRNGRLTAREALPDWTRRDRRPRPDIEMRRQSDGASGGQPLWGRSVDVGRARAIVGYARLRAPGLSETHFGPAYRSRLSPCRTGCDRLIAPMASDASYHARSRENITVQERSLRSRMQRLRETGHGRRMVNGARRLDAFVSSPFCGPIRGAPQRATRGTNG